jgi:hypothetical protein
MLDICAQAIEPSVPATLGVLVYNQGNGTAHAVEMHSVQPQIIDNQKGLYVSFTIAGVLLGNTPSAAALRSVRPAL